MDERLARFEQVLDRTVPWLVITLIPVLILSLVLGPEHPFERYTSWFDSFVIAAIIIDLTFKARHAASVPGFLKAHWFAIISLLPIFIVLRMFEEVAFLVDAVQTAQEAGSEVNAIRRESSLLHRNRSAPRMSLFHRLARPLARMPRLARAAEFFHHPDRRAAR